MIAHAIFIDRDFRTSSPHLAAESPALVARRKSMLDAVGNSGASTHMDSMATLMPLKELFTGDMMRQIQGRNFARGGSRFYLFAIGIFCLAIIISAPALYAQQTLREHIFLNGKAIAVETRAITPPTVSITSPTSGTAYSTSASSITLGGSASDDQAVSLVSWSNSLGSGDDCGGTTTWTCSAIPLQNGSNIITVEAYDNENNATVDVLTVNRTSCTYSISPTSASVPYTGGQSAAGTLVTTSSGCSWTSTSQAGWITIASGSGTGSGAATFNVAPLSCPASGRSGTVTVAGQNFTVNQGGCSDCTACAMACMAAGNPPEYCAYVCGCW